MSSYPCPSHALQVWLVGDEIAIGIPGREAGRGHTLFVKPSEAGIKQLYAVLSERLQGAQAPKIGQRGAPTQYDLRAIEQALQRRVAPQAKPKPAKAFLTLEELGL